MRNVIIQGVRDPSLVRQEYEGYWGSFLDRIRRIVELEPRSLARAMSLCAAVQAERPARARWHRGRRVGSLLAGSLLSLQLSEHSRAGISRLVVANMLLESVGPQTKRIVELGSGWGANIFHLWLAGAPASAEYAALEYTAAGREATHLLATLEPALRLVTRPFDYNKPDLTEFRSADKTVVFTCYSIEQMTHLNGSLFDELLAIPGLERVIHIEPVGWQTRPVLWRAAVSAGTYIVPPGISLAVDVRRATRRRRYNVDLVDSLRALERAGRIAIERIEHDFTGVNPLTPGTAIVWHPVRYSSSKAVSDRPPTTEGNRADA